MPQVPGTKLCAICNESGHLIFDSPHKPGVWAHPHCIYGKGMPKLAISEAMTRFLNQQYQSGPGTAKENFIHTIRLSEGDGEGDVSATRQQEVDARAYMIALGVNPETQKAWTEDELLDLMKPFQDDYNFFEEVAYKVLEITQQFLDKLA